MYDVNATISIGSLSVKVIDSIYSYRLDGGVVFYAGSIDWQDCSEATPRRGGLVSI